MKNENSNTLTERQQQADFCISCDQRKYSAGRNPDGLCDECNGGLYLNAHNTHKAK